MRILKYLAFLFLFAFLTTGCKIEYRPSVQSPATGYLVVEGFINSDGGPTTITLSRTIKLYDSVRDMHEHNALVSIEGQNNESYPLYETGDGVYTSSSLNLNSSEKYRLKIKTSNGKEYVSDYTSYRTTPDIDSLSWARDNNGVNIFINTHDDQNPTGYYYWKYEETWEFHARYYSSLVYVFYKSVPVNVKYRNADQSVDTSIYKCWKTVNSSDIILTSTEKQNRNQVYFPIMSIEPASEKLSVLYSINVRQYALSKEGYTYLEKLKKNTEEIGSIFAAQPTELTGNIHCTTNPSEITIGFIEVSQLKQKRLFISNQEVPDWNYSQGCSETIIQNNPGELALKGVGLYPTVPFEISPLGSAVISFYATPEPTCMDCTFRGSNVKPAFWP